MKSRELPALLVLVASMAWLFWRLASFRSVENMTQIGQQAGLLGIMACGEALVVLTGGIDLSIGAVAAFAACVCGGRLHMGLAWPLAIIMGVGAGAVVGWINGALITYRKLPPILTTLAMLLALRAVTNITTKAVPYNDFPEAFKSIGLGMNPLWIFVLLVAGLVIMNARTRFGRHVIATGGSELSARLTGIRTESVVRKVYMLSGLCAGLGGILLSAASNTAQWSLAEGYELDVIAAVVIGGIKLTGGEGSVMGAALGAAIIVLWRNGLILLGVPPEQYGFVTAAIILLAAFAEQLRRRRDQQMAGGHA